MNTMLMEERAKRGLPPYAEFVPSFTRPRVDTGEPVKYKRAKLVNPRPKRRRGPRPPLRRVVCAGGCGKVVDTRKPEGEPSFCLKCRPHQRKKREAAC